MSLWMESLSVTIQMKATKQYFPVVLFIMFSIQSVDKILWCDYSIETSLILLSYGTFR